MSNTNRSLSASADSHALLNEQQASKYLNISLSTLRRRRMNGHLPRFIKLGKSVRYSKEALDSFVRENTKRCK
jgi:excisionase family DNA binding protein